LDWQTRQHHKLSLPSHAPSSPGWRTRPRLPWLLVSIATVVCLLAAMPLIYITYHALQARPDLWRQLIVGQLPRLLGNTLALVATVVTGTCIIGTVTAWLVERTDLPGRTIWRWLLALPLAIPGYVAAVCAMFLLRRGGFIDQLAMQYLGFERHQFPLPPLFTLGGVTVIMALYTFPFVFLAVSAALRALDITLDEAARVSGRGPVQVFCSLTVPMLLPAIASGGLLVGLYVLSDFGTVALLRYQTFTTAVYRQFAGTVGREAASIVSLGLIGLSLLLLGGEAWINQRDRVYTRAGTWQPRRLLHLQRWRWPAFAGVFGLATLALFLPLLVLSGLTIRGIVAPTAIDRIWSVGSETIWRYGWNSLLVAVLAATSATALAVAPVFLAARYRGVYAQTLLNLSKIAFALPGILIGLGFLMFFLRTPLYATLVALVCGLAFRLLPKTLTTTEATLAFVSPTLEQAAQTLGAGIGATLWRVTFPLAAPGLLAGWAPAFATAMKELPLLVILRPPGFDTLSIRIWEAANDSIYTQAAPPALLMIMLTTCTLGLVYTIRHFGLDQVVHIHDSKPE
jgi:iron(III) transport system permease protein